MPETARCNRVLKQKLPLASRAEAESCAAPESFPLAAVAAV